MMSAPKSQSGPDTALRQVQGITVVDNLLRLDEQQQIFRFLSGPGWQYGWTSRAGGDVQPFWHRHFAGALDAADAQGSEVQSEVQPEVPDCAAQLETHAPLLHAFWQVLQPAMFKDHVLERCYANGLPYGTDGAMHTDSPLPGACTAVYYPHEQWHPDWGGETVLFNQDGTDILTAIYPKPNRLAVFPGFIKHVARGVSRSCPHMRITLMFKTRLR